MLNKIKDFQKLAKESNRNHNSVNEFIMYLEAIEKTKISKLDKKIADMYMNRYTPTSGMEAVELIATIFYNNDYMYMLDDNSFVNENFIREIENNIDRFKEDIKKALDTDTDDDDELIHLINDNYRSEGTKLYEEIYSEFGGTITEYFEEFWFYTKDIKKWDRYSPKTYYSNNNSDEVVNTIVTWLFDNQENYSILSDIMNDIYPSKNEIIEHLNVHNLDLKDITDFMELDENEELIKEIETELEEEKKEKKQLKEKQNLSKQIEDAKKYIDNLPEEVKRQLGIK